MSDSRKQQPHSSDTGSHEKPEANKLRETTPVIIKSGGSPEGLTAEAVRGGLHIVSPQVPFEIIDADPADERAWSRSMSGGEGVLTDMTVREGDNAIDVPLGVLQATTIQLEFDSGQGGMTISRDSQSEKLSFVAAGYEFEAVVDRVLKMPNWIVSSSRNHSAITRVSVRNSANTELFRYTCATGRLPQIEIFFERL